MKITFLGTSGSFPTANRGLPAIAVTRDGELLLFDCGEGTQRQMVLSKTKFSSKMKLFITHMHGDHVLGLPGLFQSMSLFDRRMPVKIYGPIGLYDFVKAFKETVKFSLTFSIEVKEVEEGVICREKEYSVEAAMADHAIPDLAYALTEKERPGIFYPEKAKALGVPEGPLWSKLQHRRKITLPSGKIITASQVLGPSRRGRKIVYSGDTRPCEAVLRLAECADVLIHEATFDDNLSDKANENGHSTPSQAAEIAKEAGVKRLVLTHIGGRYLHVEELLEQACNIFSSVDLAEDFMEIEVPYID
ncbi:MAG: ribonuclease Z [Candidatus Bathyarchaeota archaeon]